MDVRLLSPKFKKTAFYLLLLILAFFQFLAGWVPGWQEIRSDFPNYYVASRLIIENRDLSRLYDNHWFQEQIDHYGIKAAGKFSPFPPPSAVLMLPFSKMDPLAAKRCWMGLQILLLFACLRLIVRISGLSMLQSWCILFASGMAMANNFYLGQVYILLLWLLLQAYWAINNEKSSGVGIVAGSGIAIKYVPVLFFPVLLVLNKWRMLVAAMVVLIIIHSVCLFLFGSTVYLEYMQVLLQHLRGDLEGQSPWSPAFQSWNALGHRIFLYHPTENPNPFFPSNTAFVFFKLNVHLILLGFSAYLFYRIRRDHFFLEKSIALLISTLLLLTPAGASYHQLIMIVPIVVLYKMMNQNGQKISWIILLLLFSFTGFFPVLQQILPEITSMPGLAFYRLGLNLISFCVISYSVWPVKPSEILN